MTCTVTISLPNLVLVGADTRLNMLEDDGSWRRFDARLGSFELRSGQFLPIPDGCRKIRRVGDTWAAGTGDAITCALAFSWLQSLDIRRETLLGEWTSERSRIRSSSHTGSGHPFDEIDKTRIMVALRGNAPGVITLGMVEAASTHADTPLTQPVHYTITWPPGVIASDSEQARPVFFESLQAATHASDLFGAIRAVVTVIKFACERCDTVGPLVQLGFSVGGPYEGMRHYRIEGDASELLLLENADLRARFISVE